MKILMYSSTDRFHSRSNSKTSHRWAVQPPPILFGFKMLSISRGIAIILLSLRLSKRISMVVCAHFLRYSIMG